MPRLNLQLQGFLWSRLCEQAEAEGVVVEAIVEHAVAYYLADLDRGRMAAHPPSRDELDGLDGMEQARLVELLSELRRD